MHFCVSLTIFSTFTDALNVSHKMNLAHKDISDTIIWWKHRAKPIQSLTLTVWSVCDIKVTSCLRLGAGSNQTDVLPRQLQVPACASGSDDTDVRWQDHPERDGMRKRGKIKKLTQNFILLLFFYEVKNNNNKYGGSK